MEGPADLRVHAYSPARLFTIEEAQALVARLTELFRRMDPSIQEAREARELLEDAEAYWGPSLSAMPLEEKRAYAANTARLEAAKASLDRDLADVRSLGCEVKEVEQGLVDFPAIVEGALAFLCWRRGEPRVAFWHTLDGGFAGRKPLASKAQAER